MNKKYSTNILLTTLNFFTLSVRGIKRKVLFRSILLLNIFLLNPSFGSKTINITKPSDSNTYHYYVVNYYLTNQYSEFYKIKLKKTITKKDKNILDTFNDIIKKKVYNLKGNEKVGQIFILSYTGNKTTAFNGFYKKSFSNWVDFSEIKNDISMHDPNDIKKVNNLFNNNNNTIEIYDEDKNKWIPALIKNNFKKIGVGSIILAISLFYKYFFTSKDKKEEKDLEAIEEVEL